MSRPPPAFHGPMVAAIAFGNSTTMPILLLSVITDTLKSWWLREHQISSVPDYAADSLVYIGLYGIFYPVLTWSVGSCWSRQAVRFFITSSNSHSSGLALR